MNREATIVCDPICQCAYFLSLMQGSKTDGWVQQTYDWLDKVENDPEKHLPFNMNVWQALEAKFKKSFINYAEHECTQDELCRLRMKDNNVDEYIASFQILRYHVGMSINDPSMLRIFAQGLLHQLADTCIDINSPKNFEQWANTAQQQHKN